MGPVELMRAHQRQYLEAMARFGGRDLRAIYTRGIALLGSRVQSVWRDKTFGTQHMRLVLEQLRRGIAAMEGDLDALLLGATRSVAGLGVAGVSAEVRALARRFAGQFPLLSIDEAAILGRARKDVESSILRRVKGGRQPGQIGVTKSAWSLPLIGRMEEELSAAALVNQPRDATIARIAEVAQVESWRAERVVRSESAHAYGVSRRDAMQEVAAEVPGLMQVWVETFDARTGDDSYVMHGQMVPMGQPFVWMKPKPKKQGGGFERVELLHGPNRPGDRSTCVPFREGLPVPSMLAPLSNAALKLRGIEVPPGRLDDGTYRASSIRGGILARTSRRPP